MNIFYFIGGSGGIYFWYNQWRYRNRVQVSLISETYDEKAGSTFVRLELECINLGDMVTSVNPDIQIKAITPHKSKLNFKINIQSADRTLFPHEPKSIIFAGTCEPSYIFGWFKHYKIGYSRGAKSNVYTLNASGKKINWYQSAIGSFKYRVFNKPPA